MTLPESRPHRFDARLKLSTFENIFRICENHWRAGVARALRNRDPNVRIYLTDPEGAAVLRWYTEGALRAVGSSITEGIGQGRLTGNMLADNFRPDGCFEV